MTPPQFGLGVKGSGTPSEHRDLASLAEELGFDVLSVFGDLGFQPPLPVLLAMASATRRIRLGPACLNPYTLHPLEIAGQMAALEAVSQGRAYLGLARGAWLELAGVRQTRPLTTLREAAQVVGRLLAGDDSGFRGQVFSLAPGVRLRYALPHRRLPLLIGTWSPRTAALAGEIADELKIGGTADPEVASRLLSWANGGPQGTGAGQARPAGGGVALVMGAVTVVDPDGAAARRRAKLEAAPYLDVVGSLHPSLVWPPGLLEQLRLRLRTGDLEAAGELVPDQLLDRFAFAGTPAEVAQRARALLEAGCRRVEFGPPWGLQPERGLRLLAREVLPRLR